MKTHLKIISLISLLVLTVVTGCKNDEEILDNEKNELVAVAGDDISTKVNEEILLDGSASHHKSNKSFTYSWSIKAKPQGSSATVALPTVAKPSFTPDVAGVYLIQLQIAQGKWTAKDELVVVALDDIQTPVAVVLDEDIEETTTLEDIFEDPTQPDYIVTKDILVNAGLVIEPGAVIAFEENTGLKIISGSIQAVGIQGKPIAFRGLEEGVGYWKGIAIHTNNELNEFDYVTVEHGGSQPIAESLTKANVLLVGSGISGAALKVKRSAFQKSGGYGLYVQGMSYLNAFSENSFSGNIAAGIFAPAKEIHKLSTAQLSGDNGFDGIETSGIVEVGEDAMWRNLSGRSYFISGDLVIRSGVSIEPGTTFKIKSGVTISVTGDGYLNSSGTEMSKIVFTSYATSGTWNGLFIETEHPNNKLYFTEVANAGQNKIPGMDHEANIAIGNNGKIEVKNSLIRNGLGYGIVAKSADRFNGDILVSNIFMNLQKGDVYPSTVIDPVIPSIEGVWFDQWSFQQGASGLSDGFYDESTGIWFGGVSQPWDMVGAGFGIRIDEQKNFVWTVAEHSPMTGCVSYSAEYMKGSVQIDPETITFSQELWRSKFVNSCDASQNVDMSVSPQDIEIRYEVNKLYDLFSGEAFWELKFLNLDGSTFSYYRK